MDENTKRCIVCNTEYKLTSDYWHKNRRNVDSFDNTCKKCKNSGRTLGKVKRRKTNGTDYIKCADFQFPGEYMCTGCWKLENRPYNEEWEDYINKVVLNHSLEFMIELPSESVDLIITDPPYADEQKSIVGNELMGEEYVHEMFRILKPGGALYSFSSLARLHDFTTIYSKYFKIKTPLIWYKRALQMGNQVYDYASQAEMILYASKGDHKLNCGRTGNFMDYGRCDNTYHPMQKPIDLICELIKNSSEEGDLVFDPFAGSGSTLVAAKLLGRRYIGCEIDKKWHDEAVSRILNLHASEVSKEIKGVDSRENEDD